MAARTRLTHLDPKKIKIPSVRITSVWDPEEYEVFKASIDADGIIDPIQCVKEGDTYWLADGKHRLDEAIMSGQKRIAVAYREGSLVDAKTRNLLMNRLRGRTSVIEEIALIKSLQEEDGLSLEDIIERTGWSRKLIEERIQIGAAHDLVIRALDQDSIGVGVAYQLSRLPRQESQIALLTEFMATIPKATTQWCKEIVDDILEYERERRENPQVEKPIIPVRTIECGLCSQAYEQKDMIGVNVCRTCYGVARDYIQRRLKEQSEELSPKEALVRKIAGAGEQ